MTLPLSYSRPLRTVVSAKQKRLHCPLVTNHSPLLSGGQGRIRTSVDRKGRQVYSLLLLTAQPPVRSGFAQATMRFAAPLII